MDNQTTHALTPAEIEGLPDELLAQLALTAGPMHEAVKAVIAAIAQQENGK